MELLSIQFKARPRRKKANLPDTNVSFALLGVGERERSSVRALYLSYRTVTSVLIDTERLTDAGRIHCRTLGELIGGFEGEIQGLLNAAQACKSCF